MQYSRDHYFVEKYQADQHRQEIKNRADVELTYRYAAHALNMLAYLSGDAAATYADEALDADTVIPTFSWGDVPEGTFDN